MLEPFDSWLWRPESIALKNELLIHTNLSVFGYFGPLKLNYNWQTRTILSNTEFGSISILW